MRSRNAILVTEVKDWILRHVSMAKSRWSVFCAWPLPADLPANVLPEEK